MKKVKKMAIGGVGSALGAAAAKAIAAKKPMGLGEGIARAAGVPVGKTVNAPATIQPIGGMRPPGQGTTGGPLVKPFFPPGVKLPPDSGMGSPRPSGTGAPSNTMQQLQSVLKGSPTKPGMTTLASGQVVPTAQYNALRKLGGFGMKKGGKVSSASKRADGIATKGKTKGKIV